MLERLLSPSDVQCPFPLYSTLRASDPVHHVPGQDLYLVTRYDDCVDILNNTDLFSSKLGPGLRGKPSPPVKAVMEKGYRLVRTLLTNDPPDHRKYRRIVNRMLTARRVAAMEPAIRRVIAELLGPLGDKSQIDFVGDFAIPLPIMVIADFLGVPRGDLPTFKRWSDDAAAIMSGQLTEEAEVACHKSLVELLNYFADQVAERRAGRGADFLSRLANSDDDDLSMEEIIALAYVVLVAGNETTVNLLSAMMLLLLQQPEIAADMRADRSLIPAVIEETLRLQSPIQGIPRLVTRDTSIRGVPVPAGSRLLVMVAAANRDPAVFSDPETLRGDRTGRAHLAFGQGIHFCVGAALSRLEADLAFNMLYDQFTYIEQPEDAAVRFLDNPILRTLESLPVRMHQGQRVP